MPQMKLDGEIKIEPNRYGYGIMNKLHQCRDYGPGNCKKVEGQTRHCSKCGWDTFI